MTDDHLQESDEDEAETLLEHLLDAASRRLSRMAQPAVIMFYPDREGYRDRADWLAVQVGQATWDQCIWHENDQSLEETLAAREVLAWLHPEWLELMARAFGLAPRKRVVAIVSQHGAQWLVFDHGEYTVFLITDGGRLELVGEAFENLGNRLGENTPLLLKRIDPAALLMLQLAVPELPLTDGMIREKS